MASLAQMLAGRRVYLDANVFIYFLSGSSPWAQATGDLLAAARDGHFRPVTGEAVIAEVMVGPYRHRDPLLIRSVREFFAQPGFLDIVSHSGESWDDAAMLRGTMGVPLIDALHVATAAHARCDVVVTNDQRMQSALGVDVLSLSELA